MRILHTSDWHLGRTLEGRSREEEQVKFIDELNDIAKAESIDLVIVAGDVFDSVNPSASAEELYYDALERLSGRGQRGVLVIAGNHDNPDRLCAAVPLASHRGIVLYGSPLDDLGSRATAVEGRASLIAGGQGWAEIQIPGCSEHAVVVMLPYPSESRMNRVFAGFAVDDRAYVQGYSECVREYLSRASHQFRDDTVNLGVSHLFISGGMSSDSERPIHLGGAPEVSSDLLPAKAHYVALGHLHRPQAVPGAPCPARYSGSPLAYSFSEAGITKSVIIIDALPGRAASVKEVYLKSGSPLVKWCAEKGLAEVHRWIDEGRDADCWIDLQIHLDSPLTGSEVKELRDMRGRIVSIRPIFALTEEVPAQSRDELPMDQLFRLFFSRHNNGAEAQDEVVRLFMSMVSEESPEENARGEE